MPKILIADDDKVSRALFKAILSVGRADHEFLFAKDGMEALALARNAAPDLVLLDVVMPVLDGFGTLAALKKDPAVKHIPVIIITAVGDMDQKIKGFSLGAADYIVKPVHGVEAVARVEAHLRIKRDQDELKALNQAILRTQRALVESSKMAAVGSLAAGVAHEFNNILFIMSGYLQMYAKSSDPDEMRRIASVFSELVERGGSVVKGLMDFARADEKSTRRSTDIANILSQDILLLSKRMRDVGVEVSSELGEVPSVACVPGKISQVFVNLMLNAVDAMETSPLRKLDIRLRYCPPRGGVCVCDKARDCSSSFGCVLISFRDTGDGIPDSVRERVFDPFVTTKGVLGGGNVTSPGKGLGLFISYGIVRNHGGFIVVESVKGEGSVFSVALPAERTLPAVSEQDGGKADA